MRYNMRVSQFSLQATLCMYRVAASILQRLISLERYHHAVTISGHDHGQVALLLWKFYSEFFWPDKRFDVHQRTIPKGPSFKAIPATASTVKLDKEQSSGSMP